MDAFFDWMVEIFLWIKEKPSRLIKVILEIWFVYVFFLVCFPFVALVWCSVLAIAFSYRQHKAVLDKVRRENDEFPFLSEDFIHAFHESSFPYYISSVKDILDFKSGLERLEQLVLAIRDVNNAVLEAERAVKPDPGKKSDFDPDVIEKSINQIVAAISAMMEAASKLTGFFRNDIKALILEWGEAMITELQEITRLVALEVENRRKALELKQQELAVREQEAQNRTRKLELEQLRLKKANAAAIPLRAYLDFLRVKFDAITREELAGDNHTRLFELYGALKEAFQRHHLLPPEQLEPIAPDVKRLDQIETLIDLYSEKIRRVQQDDTLDPEEQQLKINYWIRIRDRDIAELEK